jgi:hypothetical protein
MSFSSNCTSSPSKNKAESEVLGSKHPPVTCVAYKKKCNIGVLL